MITERVRQARYAYERRAGAARELGERGVRLQQEIVVLEAEADRHAKVSALLTKFAEDAQEGAKEQLEQLVTRGLQVIFGEEHSFHVVNAVKANQTVTEFVIRSAYQGDFAVDTPVLEARGGGMAAVVGFMVRLVVLLLTPGARQVLFLDETFAHLSREYEPRLAEFLREVADRAGVQIILVTHSDAYEDMADVKVHLVPDPNGNVSES